MNENFTFQRCFDPYVENFTKIVLDKEHDTKLATAIGRVINKRKNQRRVEPGNEEQSLYHKLFLQIAGDTVLEQYLDLDFVDYENISLDTTETFINRILPGKNIDIRTFSYGMFPLVYDKTYRKTIFICAMSKKEYYICGIGDKNMINGYCRKDLVISETLRNRGKSGFYGFYNLTPLSNFMYEFQKLIV